MNEKIEFAELFERFKKFSDTTFVDSSIDDYLTKLREEVGELEQAPNMTEVADCMMVLVAISKYLEGDLREEIQRKLEINESRTWQRMPDGTYHHT